MNIYHFFAQASAPEVKDKTGEVDVSAATVWERVDNLVDGFLKMLPNIGIGVLVFLIFIFVGKAVRSLVLKSMSQGDRKSLAIVLGRLSNWVILFIGFLVAMAIIAPSVKPADLLATLGVGGVAIGFAFKDILQNFLAGILILVRQPFKIGDQIKSGEHEGTVESIETRATMIKTYDGRRIVVPNGSIYMDAVVVNTAYDERRSQYDVGVGYGDDLGKAIEAMMEAMNSVDAVMDDPAPQVLAMELAGSSVNLRARWWTDTRRSDVMKTKHEVILAIKRALDDAAVDMPYPTQVVLFHDQTEKSDGDRSRQREGWPAGDNPPEPAKIATALQGENRSEQEGENRRGKEKSKGTQSAREHYAETT